MAISLKHSFTSAKADDADTSLVRPSDWNAEHNLLMATSRLLGRTTAGDGAAEEISVGTGLTLSAGSLAVTGGTYAAASHTHPASEISDSTAAGRSMLTAANATAQTALLDAFTSGAKGLAPASGGGTTNFLRADGSWAAPPAGGSVALDDITDVTITAAATGDILRYNGSAWVDYADSNFAAASHTHGSSDVTDSIISQTADFSFALTDANDTVVVDSASAVIATIPTNASVSFAVGTRLRIYRKGAGTVKVSPAGGVTLRLPTGIKPKRFMGALVKKSGDETAANYSGGVALGWNAEVYDTDGFHDNVTNNSRLTVASGLGITKVRFGGHVRIQNLIANDWVQLAVRKAGSLDFDGLSALFSETDNTGADVIISSSPISVSGGDYFEEYLTVQGDTSIDIIAARSSFSIEVTEIDAQGFVAYQYGAIEIQKVGTDEWIVTDQSALG